MAEVNEVVGVDLGGTHLRAALVRNYKVVDYIKKDTPKDKPADKTGK